MPPSVSLGFFLFTFSLFGFEHCHHISYFCDMTKSFWFFGFFHLCLGTFDHWGSFCIFLALDPSAGCDLSQCYFQEKHIRLKKELQRIFFSIVKGLSKIAWIGKLCFLLYKYAKWFLIIHLVKTQLWSHLMVFGFFFRFFFLGDCLNF
jgi:hypothetical protein